MPGRLVVPTPEELFRLLKLCGSEALVAKHLAKVFDVPFEAVAPVVHEWVQNLPEVPPPSRQRSAPGAPEMLSGFQLTTRAQTRDQFAGPSKPEMIKIREPPASAPVRPSSEEMMRTMARLDHRINHSLLAANSTLYRKPLRTMERAEFRPALQLPPTVPEHANGEDESREAAIRKYLERSKVSLGHAQKGGTRMLRF